MAEDYLNVALDWDDEIEDSESEFIILPEGDYTFEIKGIEKTRYEAKPGSKLASCPQADVKLAVYDPNEPNNIAYITDHLKLNKKLEWIICDFFESIGDKEEGKNVKPNWNRDHLVGMKGRCHVVKKTSSQGNDFNNIGKYLPPITEKDDIGW